MKNMVDRKEEDGEHEMEFWNNDVKYGTQILMTHLNDQITKEMSQLKRYITVV